MSKNIMKDLNYKILNYEGGSHWDYVEGICQLAQNLQPEQTLRVCVGTANLEWDINKLKHYANKLKQNLFGRVFGFTPSVWVESILTSNTSRKHFVYLDIEKHKQIKGEAA